jgi:hypothetical protein
VFPKQDSAPWSRSQQTANTVPLSVSTHFFTQKPVINVFVTFCKALLSGRYTCYWFVFLSRSILPYLGPPNVAIDGNMDFIGVETNVMELRKDFVSEGIGLQLSGTRLNLLTTV